MTDVFVGLGSNLGDREKYILSAAEHLQVLVLSPVYETEPWRVDSHPAYLNAVAFCRTDLSAERFLNRVKEIECRHGRPKTYGPPVPRTLDIDILTFGDDVRNDTPVVPHPRLHLRAFVLRPWRDIAPEFVVPFFYKTVSKLYEELDDDEKATTRLFVPAKSQ